MSKSLAVDWPVLLDQLEMGATIPDVALENGLVQWTLRRHALEAGMRAADHDGTHRGSKAGRVIPMLPTRFATEHAPPASGHGRRLDHEERVFIQIRRDDGWSLRRIALAIGVAASTVSRELRLRPLLMDGTYSARRAQAHADQQRARPRGSKLDSNLPLRAQVVNWINDKFSPQQIQHRLVEEFPDEETMRVSHETIYQALYVQGRGSLREELKVQKALRSGRTSRKPRSKLPVNFQSWITGYELSERPAEAEDRAVPGHWEGDLVIGANHKSALITLVERSTRFMLAKKLGYGYTASTVAKDLAGMMATVPAELRRTLTWDRGAEMAAHVEFTLVTGTKVYFCDPYSPWQRGSNENTNGLIRDFYPKGTDFREVSDEDIHEMQRLLNIRPRQTLGWKNPAEALVVALTT